MGQSLRTIALVVLGAAPGSVFGQVAPTTPYLQIVREVVKIGHAGAAHAATEVNWLAAYRRTGIANHYLAMETAFGPTEAWFVSGHQSLAAIEELNVAIANSPGLGKTLERNWAADAAHLVDARVLLLRHRPALTYGPGPALPTTRMMEVTIFRVRPGGEGGFSEAATLYRTAVEQAKVPVHWATYEVMAGMPGPTYMVFSAKNSMADLDPGPVEKAISAEIGKRLAAASQSLISIETLVFNFSPEMSYLPAAWIAQDPKFWGRSALPARAAAAPRPPNQ